VDEKHSSEILLSPRGRGKTQISCFRFNVAVVAPKKICIYFILFESGDDRSIMMTCSLKHAWFDSTLRYCDSLFVISCQNSSGEILAETQASYARFLLAGGSNSTKVPSCDEMRCDCDCDCDVM
jgi:hypothetical protein